ncbi:MAG: hypothetical protein ACLR0S_04335 [Hominenteromicrobium sp.]|uniref:hypothetical protein n=1 Tax=Hominenteromicrobium sp. TaxID=3073581 RepID=UPI0039A389C2
MDVLRFLSMMFIVTIHTLQHGNVLSTVVPRTSNYILAYGLFSIVNVGVDVFALISGFVGYRVEIRRLKWKNFFFAMANSSFLFDGIHDLLFDFRRFGFGKKYFIVSYTDNKSDILVFYFVFFCFSASTIYELHCCFKYKKTKLFLHFLWE